MRALRNSLLYTAVTAAVMFGLIGLPVKAEDQDENGGHAKNAAVGSDYRHVLLISVDGMHAIDLTKWIAANPNSNIAKLANHGIIYPNAFTTAPSDSYPGIIAQATGGTSKTAGLFYDDSYDRKGFPSKAFYTSQGLPDAGCTGNPGTELTNFEALDKNFSFAAGLAADFTGGGTLGKVDTQLDPTHMQRRLDHGNCMPVFPHQYIHTNTIFEVIKAAGRRTAWSDKHAAYEILSGPSGKGLDELYTPEINAQDTLDAGALSGDDYTKSFTGVRTYDTIKVKAVLNWIDGLNGAGTKHQTVPAIFGMNFQAVSVGQKLAKAGGADVNKALVGGYLDANANPGNALSLQFQFVDKAIGQFEQELVAKHLDKSTLIIISAKHGQSPIDPKARVAISDAAYANAPGFGSHGFEICDDEALVWLAPEFQKAINPGTGHPYYADAKAYILAHASQLKIAQLLDRTAITPLYGDPFKSTRVPDFIALTNHGVICTGGSKLAEHGGFSNDDRNVALLLSSPKISPEKVTTVSFTTQIAPTILHALGLNPHHLKSVVKEGTAVLGH